MADAGARRRAAEEARRLVEERERAAVERRAARPSGAEAEGGGGEGAEEAADAERAQGRAFAWKKGQAAPPQEEPSAEEAAQDGEEAFPTEEECALGVQRMISGAIYGMREGLELLGLPSEPLFFVRGKQLLLLGRDIRSAVNGIIHEWMTENKEEFRARLRVLQREMWDLESRVRLDRDFHQTEGLPWEEEEEEEEEELEESGEEGSKAGSEASRPWSLGSESVGSLESDVAPEEEKEEAPRSSPEAAVAWSLPDISDDLYDLLGVDSHVSLSQLRARFRKLVMSHHPSRGGDEEMFERMQEAFAVLSHHGKRQAYDARRKQPA